MINREAMKMPGWHGADGDAAYLDKTLRHEEMEYKLDEAVTWHAILQLFAQAFLISLGAFVIVSILSFVFFLADPEAGASIFFSLQFLVSGVFFAVLLGSRITEPIAEWRVLLADRQEHAESVYSKIAGTLLRRAFPIRPGYHRVYNGFGRDSISNRLMLKDGHYDVYVSVFRYGTSLYLGWMMWRSRRGHILIKQYFVDMALGMAGRNNPESRMLRTERPRAMREAVHAACREGLVTAVEGTPVPWEFGFPQGVPHISGSGGMPQVPPQAAPFAGQWNAPNATGGHMPRPASPPPPPAEPEGRTGPDGHGDGSERGGTPPP